MPRPLELHPDRLLPADTGISAIARELYSYVEQAPIVSPHGHTDPAWFAQNQPFGNATELLLRPDHYLFRMLYSQGVALEDLGIGPAKATYDPRKAWRILAKTGTFIAARLRACGWIGFFEVFGMGEMLDAETADFYFDTITDQRPTLCPRALFDRYISR
jgi:glucuronate isomerase